jgi:hypothetical protein
MTRNMSRSLSASSATEPGHQKTSGQWAEYGAWVLIGDTFN